MGSDLKYKLEKVIELKACALQSFNVWKKEAFKIQDYATSLVQSIQLQSGDWGTTGSVFIWNYTQDGKSGVLKSQMDFDEEKLKVILIGLEGDVMKIYKSYIPSVVFLPKLAGCLATVSIEYEKLNDNISAPENYVDFIVLLLNQIDAHAFHP